jgi:protein CpxP
MCNAHRKLASFMHLKLKDTIMKSIKNSLYLGLTAMSLSLASPVFAQQNPAPRPPMDQAKMMEKMQAGMEKHHSMMHDKLKITAGQEGAWKTFIEATKPAMMARGEKMKSDRKAMEGLSTPARMEKMLERSKERLAHGQKHLDALKTFYVVLTPEQQKIFDDSHRGMRHRMQRGMQHRMHERMHGPMHDDMQGGAHERKEK